MFRPFFCCKMPWDIKKNSEGKYCLFKKDDGSMVKGSCHTSRSQTAKMRAAMYANEKGMMMENVQLALAMKNPVWLGCAVTNRPHIRLKEHPLSVVDINGKKFIRVPMMRAGKYRHAQGDLDMTGEVLNQFIQNHTKGLADFEVVLDAKHQPDKGALGLFEASQGAFVQREKAGMPQVADPNGELLVAYAIPTGDDAIEVIEKGKFRHASMEFHPDYSSNVQQTYLSSDLTEIEEMTVQLGGPGSGRKGFRGGLKKAGSAFKKAGSSFKSGAKNYGKGVLGGIGEGIGTRKRQSSITGKGTKAGRFGQRVGRTFASTLVGSSLKSAISRKKYGKKKKLEVYQLNSFIPLYEDLVEYVEESPETDFVWIDTQEFDFSDTDLPIEDGHYKVDKQTAEEMLAALDELAEDEEFQHLFIEESEDDMPDDEVVDEQTTELQVALEAANQRILALEKATAVAEITAVVAEARTYVDENGMGHSAVLLNMVQDLMLGNPVGEGDGVIQLEDAADAGKVAQYFRRGLAKLLKTMPGQVKLEGKTVPDNTVTLERTQNSNGLYEQGKADAKHFWGQVF